MKHRLLSALLIASLFCTVLSGCGIKGADSTTDVTKTTEPTDSTDTMDTDKWREDIDYLASELPQRHVDLFYTLSEEEFNSRVEQLKASLDTMNEDEIRIEIKKLVASVGDAHTGTNISAEMMYPLELYYFVDGWYVINTSPAYSQILYSKLTAINGQGVDDVYAQLAEVISHENDTRLKAQMKYYFLIPSVLHGLHIIDEPEGVTFTFETRNGGSTKIDLDPISWADMQENVFVSSKDQSGLPLYRQNSDQDYWFTELSEHNALYFKYNQCGEMEDTPFAGFTQELLDAMENEAVEKLIIDLRDNGGGDEGLLFPFIHAVSGSRFDEEGRLFIIVGRQTFSSAVRNAVTLQKKTDAIFIGEPTSGKPSHFGAVDSFQLPNSGITVRYSTMHLTHVILDDTILANPDAFSDDPSAWEELEQTMLNDPDALIEDTLSLVPDQVIEISVRDYMDNQDPVLQYALDYVN